MQFLLIIIFCFLISFSPLGMARSGPATLLQCLAKEEALLHKKKSLGIIYRLNQDLVNELASSNDISIKKEYIDEICHPKNKSPSVAFLRLLLIKEKELYDISLFETDPSIGPFKMGKIEEFLKQAPRIFIQYISGIQSTMPNANCLTKSIPELIIFNDRLKHLEENLTLHQLIKDKAKINTIFNKLSDLKAIEKKCRVKPKRNPQV